MPDWNHPDTVAFFRGREPDVRLSELVAEGLIPLGANVLDLGCAAGRNAVLLAAHGFSGVAIDGSEAMVTATRERLAPFRDSAPWRVLQRQLHDLADLPDASFGLVLALGILQNASSDAMFMTAVDHLTRVCAPQGRLLVQNFGPDSQPHGRPLERVSGSEHVWRGFSSEQSDLAYTLPDAAALDAMFSVRGFAPGRPTRVVWKALPNGRRNTIVAEYLRR